MSESKTQARMGAPDFATLSVEQREIVEAAIKKLGGPYGPRIPLLNSPDVAVAWSQLGGAIRRSALTNAQREIAILVVGQHWQADFEWHAHAPRALAAGVTEEQLAAMKKGLDPRFEDGSMRVVYEYCRELVLTKRVSDATYAAAKRLLGSRLLVDLTALTGHFTNVAMTLNAHHVQLPPGVESPFGDMAPEFARAPRDGWVEKDGLALRHRFRVGAGPTVVFVHELGGTAESWEACIAHLPPSMSTLCVEWRGAGLSSKIRQSVSFDEVVGDLSHVIPAVLGNGPVVMVGVAAGAAMAIRLAARNQVNVIGLVATVPALGTAPEQRPAVLQMAERIEREGMQAMMAMEKTYPKALRDAHPERWSGFRSRYLGNDPSSYARLLRMVTDIDLTADIARVVCPAMVIGGTFDMRPVATMQALAGKFPDGRFEEVAAGHFMPAQMPDRLADIIGKFVSELTATCKQEV